MADEKLNTAPDDVVVSEAPATDAPEEIPVLELTEAEAVTLEKEEQAALFERGETLPDPGEAVIPLPAEKMDFVGAGGVNKGTPAEDTRQEWEKPIVEVETKQKKTKRSRPQKAEKEMPDEEKAAKPRKSRPAKADKAALDAAQPQVRDKVSRSKKPAPVKDTPVSKENIPIPEPIPAPEEPTAPPRPIEDGQLVYLKLSELHAPL